MWLGLMLALCASAAAINLEIMLRRLSVWAFIGSTAGLALGSFAAWLVSFPLAAIPETDSLYLDVILYLLLGYSGLAIGLARGRDFSLSRYIRLLTGQTGQTGRTGKAGHTGGETLKIVDTSALIDGRIADVCESGFIEGPFVVPQFVLHEMQLVADSSDPVRRARGRHGLDILQRMRNMAGIDVRIAGEDYPGLSEVDDKLVALARSMNGKVLTNDFNLGKVCEVQDVPVLNVNVLAGALRPVMIPGETMPVAIVKEGKEPGQGVAYLDDGTMVVVENGRELLGRTADVSVTSVIQTAAGRMIFAKLRD
ncbi:MAG: TRAM domain-containing protein [Nitrospirae bacterium]|nr:TRAM domain-containing protein [Nitrospirota bacterium]